MSSEDRVSSGVLLWVGWTLGAVVVISFVAGLMTGLTGSGAAGAAFGPIALFQVGAWQWLYVIPLLIFLRRKQRFQTAKGLLIIACVLFGVDVLCSGGLLLNLYHTSFR